VTNVKRARAQTKEYRAALPLQAGDEIMAFHLGSTVVVLFEPGRVKLSSMLQPGEEVLLGQPIAGQ
jgi:phosphatidylserine decarboxylase